MTSHSAATLRSRYVEQAASDLQENRRRQQELAESLKVLKQEEALLLDILSLTERYETASDPAQLPVQAEDEPVLTSEKPAEKPAEESPEKPVEKPAVKAEGKVKAKAPQPLLGDLLIQLLDGYDEPRHAKELREELLEKYPDRSPTPQVVRNTLESLVAKGRIRRHKQRRSVMYSVV